MRSTGDYDPEEAVTVAVAARRLGVDTSTVRAMVRNGQLAGFKVGKGRQPGGVRIEAESIREYKRRHAIAKAAELEPAALPRRRASSAAERELEAELRALGVDVDDRPRQKPTREVLEMRRQLRELGMDVESDAPAAKAIRRLKARGVIR